MKKNSILDEQEIRDLLLRAGRPLRLDDVLRIGHYSRKIKRDILAALHGLGESGFAVRIRGGGWIAAASLRTCAGRFAAQRSGAGFVSPEGAPETQDVYIAPEHAGGAWNGDRVEIVLLPGGGHARKEGMVLNVLERSCTHLAARVMHAQGRRLFCRPADPRMTFDLLVSAELPGYAPRPCDMLDVVPGQQLESEGLRPLWSGQATAFLGSETDAASQERLVKINYAIPESFPDNVTAAAERAAADTALSGLEDMRGELFVTIDGEDARDFDDAICVRHDPQGWRLLVAIADVSHYVRPGTPLDREAWERGNSFYFPLSVEPMLPGALCDGICSLRPGEERRCMAVDIRLDASGNCRSASFSNAVMISKARLTYRQVQAVLDAPGGEAALGLERAAPGVPAMLREAAALASVLIRWRAARGGLDLDLPEAEFTVSDDDGVRSVTGIRNRERLFSHRLIEAFMVRANECVAEYLSRKGAPFLYRAHPAPDQERMDALQRSLRAACPALDLPAGSPASPKWLQAVLGSAAGDNGPVVAGLVLRSMMQARYATEKEGHFGLASDCYCHFTSPIRRYADLENHRALKHALGLEPHGPALHDLQKSAEQCNRQERTAAAAEREMGRRMACLLLQPHAGETFSGVISAVTSFGLFVQFGNMPAEGMVRVETLPRDWYAFDDEGLALRGVQSGKAYRLGQRVTVRLIDTNIERLEINMELSDKDRQDKESGGSTDRDRGQKRGREEKGSGRRSAFARRAKRGRSDRDRRQMHGHDSRGDADRESIPGKKRFSRWQADEDPRGPQRGSRDDLQRDRAFRRHRDSEGRGKPFRDGDHPSGEGGDAFRKERRHDGPRAERHGGRRFGMEEGYPRREDHGGRRPAGRQGWDRERSRDEDRPFGDGRDTSRRERPFDDRPAKRRGREAFGREDRFAGDGGHGGRRTEGRQSWGRERFRDEDRPFEDRRGTSRRERPFDDRPAKRRGREASGREDRFAGDGRRGGQRPEERRGWGKGHARHEDRPFGGRGARRGPGGNRQERPSGGMPEDFFRIELENDEKKPVFRFGRRKK